MSMTAIAEVAESLTRTTVVVADDHAMVLETIHAALQQDGIVVLETARHADDAVEKMLALQPDIAVMDIQMPGVSCFDAITTLRSSLPNIKFVLLSGHFTDARIDKALELRVEALVAKHAGMSELITAIRQVRQGSRYYSAEILERVVVKNDQLPMSGPKRTRLDTLSTRERELLTALGEGLSLKHAATRLGVSYKTADKHKASLMAKLNIHDRVELALYAIRENFVER